MHVLPFYALKKGTNFVKFYTFATKHKVNVYNNDDLNPATVFLYGVDIWLLKCHMIQTQPFLVFLKHHLRVFYHGQSKK